MKKILLSALLWMATIPMFAQLNVQLHYDFADALYGKELSNRPHWTATIENFKADKWGSTYFFVDLDFGGNTMKSAYAEISREFKLGTSPFAAHVEYNGGLSGGGSYNDAYLAGAAWNWANQDFSKTFSFQVLYKYLARQVVGSKHSWQLTTVWGIHFAKGLCTFSGYADVWHDNSVKGNLVLSSEPQFWFNLNALESVPDDFLLSLGTEVELTKSLVWPTDGLNDRFYAIPTLAAKWTF
jgi:hypothetical protein